MVFYTYDRTGNILTADYAGEQTETNTYNELGLLTTVTTAEGDTLYQYDDASRLISVTQPNGETVSYRTQGTVPCVLTKHPNKHHGARSQSAPRAVFLLFPAPNTENRPCVLHALYLCKG